MRKLFLRLDISEQEASKTGGDLFKAFCACYRKENTFTVTDKEAKLEIFFEEELHSSIVDAISELPFAYIKELYFSDVDSPILENTEKTEDAVIVEEKNDDANHDESVTIENKPAKEENKRQRPKKVPPIDDVGRSLLEKISRESTSFDDFVQKTMDFLNIKEYYREFFVDVIRISSEVPAISWDEIQKCMEEAGLLFSVSKQVAFTRAVKAKFDECGSMSRALTVISEILKYKEFRFDMARHEESTSKESSEKYPEEPQETSLKKPECVILSQELVDEAMRKNSYFDRVGYVFDKIKTDRFDDKTYADYRSRIIDSLVSAAADNSENPQMSANDCVFFFIGKNFSSTQAHVVRAMVFQSIKDYAHSRGYEENLYTQHFLKDLRNLL